MPKRLLISLVSIALLLGLSAFIDLGEVLSTIVELPISVLVTVLILLSLNLTVVSYRLIKVLLHFGIPTTFTNAFKANASGLVASLLMVNIVGSIVGRHMTLRKAGIDPSVIAFSTGYERIIITAVSGTLAACSGVFIFGTQYIDEYFRTQPIVLILLSILFTIILTACSANSGFEQQILKRLKNPRRLFEVGEISTITLFSQVLNINVYVTIILGMGYDLSFWNLAASAALIAFAASLPISINGWGVREVASIFILATFGIPASDAVAISVSVGALNTLVVLLLIPVPFYSKKQVEFSNQNNDGPVRTDPTLDAAENLNFRKLFALGAASSTAVLLYFQFPVSISNAVITLNLADPVALIVLGYALATFIFTRSLPFRISKQTLIWLILTLLALVIGLLVGVMEFGPTSWALGNRGFGALVILGYFICGALIRSHFGTHGVRRLLEICIFAASTIVVVCLLHRIFFFLGVSDIPIPPNFEGFSANRNAFSFQLLVILAIATSYFRSRYRVSFALFILFTTIVSYGALLTGSITGLITAFSITFALMLQRKVRFTHMFGLILLSAIFFYIMFPYVWDIIFEVLFNFAGISIPREIQGIPREVQGTALAFSGSSLAERFESYKGGLDLFFTNPVLGAGIGAFVASKLADGNPLVIHSTYIWIIAELGIIGAILVGVIPFMKVRYYWRQYHGLPLHYLGGLSQNQSALVVLIAVFAIFSLTHDVAYQRTFWFFLGALLARPFTSVLNNSQKTR